MITKKGDIAETLNCFFVDQQINLTSEVGLNDDLFTGARPPPPSPLSQVSETLNIPQIPKDKVVNPLLSIPVYKATGNDGVSTKLLRIAAPAIADSLCKLIYFCIDKQTFPTKWKVTKVTPIYKGQGSRDGENNYRPITVLPILYYTILYYTIRYHTIPYHTIPYHTIPYHTILYYTRSTFVITFATSFRKMFC